MFSSEVYSAMRKLFQLFSTKTLRIQEHVSLFTACLLLVSPHPKLLKSGEKPETCTIPPKPAFFSIADLFSTCCHRVEGVQRKLVDGSLVTPPELSKSLGTLVLTTHDTTRAKVAQQKGGEVKYLGISVSRGRHGCFFSDTCFVLKWPVLNIDFDGFGNTCSPQIFRCVC